MYKIYITVENPVLGENRALVYQFDPATLTQAKWDGGFTTVRAKIDELLAAAASPARPDLSPAML